MEKRHRRKSLSDRFIVWLLTVLRASFIGRFFTSYEKVNARFESAFGGGARVSERRLAKLIEKNKLINLVPKIAHYLMRVPLRDYGVIMFMTGVPVTLLYSVKEMIIVNSNATFEMFVLGIGVSLCSVPLMFSAKSLSRNVMASKMFSKILFEYMGMDDEGFSTAAEENEVNFTIFAFVIGVGLGVASCFIMPTTTILIVLALVLAYCTLKTPEIGAIVTIICIPFVAVELLCASLTYTFICYLIKVRLGKRIFKFEYLDLWVSIAVFVFLFCGINYRDPVSSFADVASNLIIMLSYFLFANMIYSKEWFRRSIVAFTSSALIVAIIAILQKIYLELCNSFEILNDAFPDCVEVTSTLGKSTVLAQFMVIAIPFALVHMLSERTDVTKFGGFLLAAILITALFFAESSVGFVGLLVGTLLVFAFFAPKSVYLIIAVAIALPVFYFIVPQEMKEIIASTGPLQGVSVSGSLVELKDMFLLAIKYPLGLRLMGIPVEEVFGADYVDSLPIHLMATYGVITLVVFIVMLITFARVIMSYSVRAKNEYRRINGCAGLCTILGLLAVGTFSHVWQDKRIFLVFVMIMALSFAYIKVEREGEVKAPKYVDFSSAEVEIRLKEAYVYEPESRSKYVRAPRVKTKKKVKINENNEEMKVKEFSNTEKPIEDEIVEENVTEQNS